MHKIELLHIHTLTNLFRIKFGREEGERMRGGGWQKCDREFRACHCGNCLGLRGLSLSNSNCVSAAPSVSRFKCSWRGLAWVSWAGQTWRLVCPYKKHCVIDHYSGHLRMITVYKPCGQACRWPTTIVPHCGVFAPSYCFVLTERIR